MFLVYNVFYLCSFKGIRIGLERALPSVEGCKPAIGLQCAARIGGK